MNYTSDDGNRKRTSRSSKTPKSHAKAGSGEVGHSVSNPAAVGAGAAPTVGSIPLEGGVDYSAPSRFEFNGLDVRVITVGGEPWWVAADVCRALGMENARNLRAVLDADEVITLYNVESIRRGNPNVNVISESGLYSLILRSRKPQAKAFARWVTREVLPSIRKTGRYAVAEPSQALQETAASTLAVSVATLGGMVERTVAAVERLTDIVQGMSAQVSAFDQRLGAMERRLGEVEASTPGGEVASELDAAYFNNVLASTIFYPSERPWRGTLASLHSITHGWLGRQPVGSVLRSSLYLRPFAPLWRAFMRYNPQRVLKPGDGRLDEVVIYPSGSSIPSPL